MLHELIVTFITLVFPLLVAWRFGLLTSFNQPSQREEPPHLTDLGFHASATALNELTNAAVDDHHQDPQGHIHRPAAHDASHSWLASILPAAQIQRLESYFKLGNYVIDRDTGERHFEEMSIYVRVGMHLVGLFNSFLLGKNYI
jgi:hypothetical protein